jgi:hypothetical protein
MVLAGNFGMVCFSARDLLPFGFVAEPFRRFYNRAIW